SRMVWAMSSGVESLWMYPSAPASMLASTFSSSPNIEMTRASQAGLRAIAWRMTSNPLPSGKPRSISITSTASGEASSHAQASATVPRLPARTRLAQRRTLLAKNSRICASSSTINTRHIGFSSSWRQLQPTLPYSMPAARRCPLAADPMNMGTFGMPVTHLLYLHGFRSSPQSTKARKMAARVRDRHPQVNWWCPQLPPSPRLAIQLVMHGISRWPRDAMAVVGSSLGGFYATYVAEASGCRAVLLNPAIDPARDLAPYTGEHAA